VQFQEEKHTLINFRTVFLDKRKHHFKLSLFFLCAYMLGEFLGSLKGYRELKIARKTTISPDMSRFTNHNCLPESCDYTRFNLEPI